MAGRKHRSTDLDFSPPACLPTQPPKVQFQTKVRVCCSSGWRGGRSRRVKCSCEGSASDSRRGRQPLGDLQQAFLHAFGGCMGGLARPRTRSVVVW